MKTEKKILAKDLKKGDKIIVTRYTMYSEFENKNANYIKYDKRCQNKELIEVVEVKQLKESLKVITNQNNEKFYFYFTERKKFLLA